MASRHDSAQTGHGGGVASSQQGIPAGQRAQQGVAFNTDFTTVGQVSKNIFGMGSGNIVEEEKRLIGKVFEIVDRDNSGSIDMQELVEMFKLFGVNTQFLNSQLLRIMGSVGKDVDGQMSPTEFYNILSQKFEPGDSKKDVSTVFYRMDKNKDGKLDADELLEVAQMLGENVPKSEINEMIQLFNLKYVEDKKNYEMIRKKEDKSRAVNPPMPRFITLEDFYSCMMVDLSDGPANQGASPAMMAGVAGQEFGP